MRGEGINRAFLDEVVAGRTVDAYYHLGITSEDPIVERLADIRAVVIAGSPGRIASFAERWSRISGDDDIAVLPKDDRFVTHYVGRTLFCSHGMGMPSASIAVQELMRLVYAAVGGDPEALERIFWARVGTSGGIGLPGGSVVLTTECLMADLRPYRVDLGPRGLHWFDSSFPAATRREILAANADSGIPLVEARTVATQEFFLEQHRLDGAIRLDTAETKQDYLRWLYAEGVRNIEMEGAMMAAYLNTWGFPSFAMICAVLLDRLEGDQIAESPEELHAFSERSGDALFAYLRQRILAGRD